MFIIVMCRKMLYYFFNIIFLCLWLMIFSLLGFWLLFDSGEKIIFGIIVFLVFFVFMLFIVENMLVILEFVFLIGKNKF